MFLKSPHSILSKKNVHQPFLNEKMFMQAFPPVACNPDVFPVMTDRPNLIHKLAIAWNMTFIFKSLLEQQRVTFFSF